MTGKQLKVGQCRNYFRSYTHVHVLCSGNIYYIFGQVQWVMLIGVNFLVMFKFFGHIHSVILNRSLFLVYWPQSHRVTEPHTPKYTGGWTFFVPDLNKLPYSFCSQGDNTHIVTKPKQATKLSCFSVFSQKLKNYFKITLFLVGLQQFSFRDSRLTKCIVIGTLSFVRPSIPQPTKRYTHFPTSS